MGLSIRDYAKHRGVSPPAVLKAIRSGRISQEPDGTIDPVKADSAWDRNTNPAQQRKPKTAQPTPPAQAVTPTSPAQAVTPMAKPPSAPNYQASRAVKETYSARLAKLEYEKRSEKLISRDEVKIEAFNLGRRVRDRLMNIPHRMGAVLAAETDAAHIEHLIEDELRIALEELPE